MQIKSIVLFSGGLDSTTCLFWALKKNSQNPNSILALSFDYHQKHSIELQKAKAIAKELRIQHLIFRLDARLFLGSSLVDKTIRVPKNKVDAHTRNQTIPNTYVPGRNLLLLSHAVSLAEGKGAKEVIIGVNALDYSGYPDCRPAFIQSFQKTSELGTKQGVETKQKDKIRIVTPLQEMTKKEIIVLGKKLQVPFSKTHSCYDPVRGKPCGTCDSCILRKRGFEEAGILDK